MSAVSLLLLESGSDVVDVTVAVLVSDAAWFGAVTTTVKVVAEPVFQLARVQVTETFPVLLQVQPPLDALTLTNVTPAGRVSVTVTFAASEGPLLAASTVYEMLPPAVTVAGPVLVIARSADAVTVASAVSVLLDGSGSDVVVEIATLLLSAVG